MGKAFQHLKIFAFDLIHSNIRGGNEDNKSNYQKGFIQAFLFLWKHQISMEDWQIFRSIDVWEIRCNVM